MLTRRRFLLLALPALAGWVGGCTKTGQPSLTTPSPTTAGDQSRLVAYPALNRWPENFWRAGAEVQLAYRYAVANPEVLQWFPCFCGCVQGGHRSNKDCYIREIRPDGSVVLDPMSFN